jgi:hypothetical protein
MMLDHHWRFGGDAYDNVIGIQPSVAFVTTRDLYFLVDIHMSWCEFSGWRALCQIVRLSGLI